MDVARLPSQQRAAVEITFAVRDGRGYLLGSEVSDRLRKLSLVEFSFFVGFPTVQIAERKTQGLERFKFQVLVQRRNLQSVFQLSIIQNSTPPTTCATPGSVQVSTHLLG